MPKEREPSEHEHAEPVHRMAAPPPDEMAGESSLRTSDPTVLRALAHPLRVEMLAVIDELGEATATQVGERVGESASNCSFHLRMLAKAGFIERAEAKGTAKPWRPAHRHRILQPDPGNPESVRSSNAVGALYVQREADRMIRFLTRHGAASEEWVRGVTVNTSTFWATPDELAELVEEIGHLADRFAGRRDPAKRPPGSRRAHLFATVNPELDVPSAGGAALGD